MQKQKELGLGLWQTDRVALIKGRHQPAKFLWHGCKIGRHLGLIYIHINIDININFVWLGNWDDSVTTIDLKYFLGIYKTLIFFKSGRVGGQKTQFLRLGGGHIFHGPWHGDNQFNFLFLILIYIVAWPSCS